MMEVEEELLKIGSYFINKHECIGDSDQFEAYNPLDRAEIVMNLMEQEFTFQFNKVLLIEQFLEGYEHTCDPLEQTRLV